MHSTMQDVPLSVRRLLEHGSTVHSGSRVLTAMPEGYTEASFAEVAANAARLAGALRGLGVGEGDRVATFMWNNQQHLEAYYAVPCMGAVIHPLNIRLPGEQIAYTANHAGDQVIIVDGSLLAPFTGLIPHLPQVRHLIVNGPADPAVVAGITGPEVHDYAALIAGQPDSYDWPDVDERQAAAMCYTSGTTGHPKGVVYSHRSIYLHSLAIALPDVFDLSAADCVLAVVPQFHVLAWGLPYTAFVTGCWLAMPDRFLAPEPLAGFVAAARPNKAAGVPTVWQGLIRYADATGADLSSLTEAVVGGSACPPSLMADYDRHGITLVHAWGMTEMSPLGTLSRPPAGARDREAYRLTQGRFPASVEPRLIGPDGSVLPHDGHSVGELLVRGPWITAGYYQEEPFADGWLRTGDVGLISPDGYLTLTDRAKDVIKSGGEWISSVELENLLMGHPAVLEAAVVGVPDERWGERPLATVVLKEKGSVAFAELQDYLAARLPKWQVPERWAFVDEVPKTSVGKIDKKVLRARHAAGELDVTTVG
ncbi:long-chain fatty acid--CoA ligase [Longispora albida]|uniref:long-chain fatty acid--CoA ligase n=1 Tax=Longispora albida TaxID=203523 RepID=UPI00037ADF06|nr:long-chain fatty acid--CoA ligase [Longispora albida]